MSGGASSTVSGSPISVLRFSRLAWTAPGSSARAMSLTEVLPTEPVIPDDPGAQRPPPGARQRLQRRQRVLNREDPAPPAVEVAFVGPDPTNAT